MSTAGRVFAVLNLVLALAFILMTAPVAKYRQEMIQKIDKESARIPVLDQEVMDLDRTRVKLEQDLNREKGNVTDAVTNGLTAKSAAEVRIAIETDTLNDAQSRAKVVSVSLADINTEIEDRKAEIEALTQTKTNEEQIQKTLRDEVADLETKLQKATSDLDRTLKELQQNYARLVELENKVQETSPSAQLAGGTP